MYFLPEKKITIVALMGDKGTATWNAQSYEDFCSIGTHLFLGTEAPTPTTLEYIEDLPHPFAPRDCAEFANVTTEQIDIQGTGDSDPAGRINYNVDEDCEAFPVTQFTPEQEPPPRPWPLIRKTNWNTQAHQQ
ncbi:hypothetical protein Pelo_13547 [Pelomyxa schiedti]|nr:hypothetical protein Pelo_13547 [Pelomyxa schiedti]